MRGAELRNKLKLLGVEMVDLAGVLGISPQDLNSKLNAKDLKFSFINKIAKALNKTVYELIENKDKEVSSKIYLDNFKGIPLIPLDAMAGFGTGESQIMDYETERYIVPEFEELNVEFMIRVKGSSMYPKYSSGDIVACKKLPLDTFFQWNKVYVLDTEQGPMIKRVKKSELKDHLLCVSENEKYDPFDLHLNHLNALAIVIGVIRLE